MVIGKPHRYPRPHRWKHKAIKTKNLKMNNLPKCFNDIQNLGITNLSQRVLSQSEKVILACGLKFCLIPNHVRNHTILQNFDKFIRRVRIRKQFINMDSISNPYYIPNPDFIPKLASDCLETYFQCRRQDINKALRDKPQSLFRRNIAINKVISDLKSDKSIIITSADKNLGIVVMDRLKYEQEVLRQLTDKTTYTPLNEYPTVTDIYQKLKAILSRHNLLTMPDNSNAMTKLAQYMLQAESKPVALAKFYLTIKIHKNPVVGRPICSSIGTMTHYTSKLLDTWLQPLARNTSFYVKNSFDFLIALEERDFKEDCIILTCDIVSLYPSIVLADGFIQLKRALTLANTPPDKINFLVDLCQWVLENNYIEFGNTVWHQTKGTAMGTPISVCFSIIYLAMLELDVMAKCQQTEEFNPPSLIKRYIDDIGSVFNDMSSVKLFVETYNAIRPNSIVLTYEISLKEGIFLDLEIYKGQRIQSGKLDTRVHQKPNNQHLYIPMFSFHNPKMFKAMIMAELHRYKILCSNNQEYLNIKVLYYNRLLARGYKTEFVQNIFENFDNEDTKRLMLIDRKLHKNKALSINNIAPLIMTLPLSMRSMSLQLNQILSNTKDDAIFDPDFHYIFGLKPRVITCYNRPKSIGDILRSSKYKYDITQLNMFNT